MPREDQVAIADWSLTPWLSQARCANEDPDLFFPVGSTGPFLEQIRRAKAICWLCPVKDECLEWALASDQRAGIWGGLTEEERRNLRQPLAEPSGPAPTGPGARSTPAGPSRPG